MAVKDTKQFLKDMNAFVDREYKRGALDKFKTIVTMTSTGFMEGFKEGYQDLLNRPGAAVRGLPELTDAEFLQAGEAAVNAVITWASKARTQGTIQAEATVWSKKVVYKADRDLKIAYTTAKQAGTDKIQNILAAKGGRPLTGASKEGKGWVGGITPRASEIGILKTAVHRAHQGTTTVGAAQVSGAFRFLERTRSFAGFADSKEASDIWDIIKAINATFITTGTKSGSQATNVSLKEGIRVAIDVLPRFKNPRGAEDYDFENLRDKIEEAVTAYIKRQNIEKMPGSPSIEQNAKDITTYMLLKELSKSTNAKVAGGIKAPKGRKKKNVKEDKKGKPKTYAGSTKKAGAAKRAIKRDRSSIVNLIGVLSDKIENTVAKNMKAPALVYRSGDFARSVEITDVTMTPQGFPSVGYTYDKYPYQTFEPGYAQGSPERDPRKLIDASIREIAMGLAIGRFYTRRV